jgi:AraC family transcriptional regulator of adaptative response/methylated-DNA-[protein]-cysteine methyltransferase
VALTLTSARLTTPIGPMLGVATEEALVLLEFEERRELARELEDLARDAAIVAGVNEPLAQLERELGEYFAGALAEFRTPLELRGTAFQRSAWRELLKIPAGTTITYLQLAHAVGNPRSFRAVAQANGANRVAVVVPCHRVVNTGGGLGGYAAGLERKRWLLEHERTFFGSQVAGRLF